MSDHFFTSYEQAIEAMKSLTSEGKAFSVGYVKADGSKGYIDRAQLGRMKASGNLQHFIPFVNVENRERRRLHITGLLAVNSIKIILQR